MREKMCAWGVKCHKFFDNIFLMKMEVVLLIFVIFVSLQYKIFWPEHLQGFRKMISDKRDNSQGIKEIGPMSVSFERKVDTQDLSLQEST